MGYKSEENRNRELYTGKAMFEHKLKFQKFYAQKEEAIKEKTLAKFQDSQIQKLNKKVKKLRTKLMSRDEYIECLKAQAGKNLPVNHVDKHDIKPNERT